VQINTYYHQQWSQEVGWEHGFGFASHQNELGIAAELGIPALIGWLAVLALLARGLVRARRAAATADLEARGLVVLGSLAFAVLVVTGLTVDLRYFDFGCSIVMMLVGMAIGVADRARSTAPDRSPHTPRRRLVEVDIDAAVLPERAPADSR
jgi:O-antigen ligase